MQKPNNYESTKAVGDFTPVAVGGHIATIVGVREQKNRNGGDMIVVAFDFASTDQQAGYFAEAYKTDTRADKKWPYAGTSYINVLDRDGNCSRSFKSFCEAVEESNAGFHINWEADFGSQFKGRAIGAVYGMVESEYNGKRRTRPELRWFIAAGKAKDAKVPEARLMDTEAQSSWQAALEAKNEPEENIPF